MWVVNFYVVIAWLQPRLVGRGLRARAHAGVGRGAHARRLRPHARRPAAARPLPALPAGGGGRAGRARARAARRSRSRRASGRRRSPAALQREGAQVYGTLLRRLPRRERRRPGPPPTMLLTKPRDFTKGIFKFRSTPSGACRPTRTCSASSPGWPRPRCRSSGCSPSASAGPSIAYVKAFYPEWERAAPGRRSLPAAAGVARLAAAVARGRAARRCSSARRAMAPRATATVRRPPSSHADAWGNPQHPSNFTKGRLKSGPEPEDVYRTFMTG